MKKTSSSHKKHTDKPLINLDLRIAQDFDLHPFLSSQLGVKLIDIILFSNEEIAKEFRDEIYKKFIEAIYDKSDEIHSNGYIVHKVPIDTTLSNWYKGNLKITKSELLKGLENNLAKANRKFEQLSLDKQIAETKIEVQYNGYKHEIKGLGASITKVTKRNINNENLSLARFLGSIVDTELSNDELQATISSSTMKSLFEYYASNIIETINHPDLDKSVLKSPQNFCILYANYKYQGNKTIDKALKSIFEFNPIMVMDSLKIARNIDLSVELCSKVIKIPSPYSDEIQVHALNLYLGTLLLGEKYELCLKQIKKYLPQTKFCNILKQSATILKEAEEYIDSKKLFTEVLKDLGIYESTDDHRPVITLSMTESGVLMCAVQNPTKVQIILSIQNSDTDMLKQFIAKLSTMRSEAIALNFVLDHLYISSDSDYILQLYQELKDIYILDAVSIQKINASKKLYKVKLEAAKHVSSLLTPKTIDTIEKNTVEEEDSSDEIDFVDLAQEAQTYIQDAEPLEIKTIKAFVKEEDPQVAIHKAFQLQKKLASAKLDKNMPEIESQSWVVNSIKITYNEEIVEDSNKKYNVKKVTTSFGSIVHVAIDPDLLDTLDLIAQNKFMSASDHWAGAFYNKSGIKLLKANGEKIGYEIKIMEDDMRLVTQNLYKNSEGEDLLIFDQKLSHEDISKLHSSSFSIENVESDILGGDIVTLEPTI